MENLIFKGGWIMAPIILGSIVALALVLERLWFLWTIRLDIERFTQNVFGAVRQKDLDEALSICSKTNHPLAEVFKVGLENAGEEAAEVERLMEREGNRQIQHVERNLNYLVVVIGVEPLLGFLGTILGLIRAFMAWERLSAAVTVSALAAGIYQAMLTTAAGLIVAIPYFVIYHFFLGKVNAISQDINHYGDELVGLLRKAGKLK